MGMLDYLIFGVDLDVFPDDEEEADDYIFL
jgi:hypothetical protein